jgi:ATP-dependent DNA ligase
VEHDARGARVGRPPAGLVLDGELVAWADGQPYFPDVCHRVLNRHLTIPLTFVVFDVLRIKGEDMTSALYSKRRAALEKLELHATHGQPTNTSQSASSWQRRQPG